jgi:phenol hydroxylase P5 protein
MKSIIYSVLDRWPGRTCRLFYGFRSAPDAFYLQVYQRLAKEYPNFRFIAAAGLIHETVERELAAGPRRQAFLCGPPEMVESVAAVLRRKGVEDIYSDAF